MAKSTRSLAQARPPRATAVIFPFDLFGAGGTARGAELLADALRELLADNRREREPTRARAYQDHLHIQEFHFETLEAYTDWRTDAQALVRRLWQRGDFVLWVSGNHLGVLPVYDELSKSAGDTLVVQLDAHLDIYHLGDCTKELSHGNFLRHCAGPLPGLINVGHRELLLTNDEIAKFYQFHFPADQVASRTGLIMGKLRRQCQRADRVFIDIDCDVLDAAFFPALAQPQPFGLSPQQLLGLIDAVWSDKVIGLAISEFAPAHDASDRSLSLLMWLVEYVLLRRYEGGANWQ